MKLKNWFAELLIFSIVALPLSAQSRLDSLKVLTVENFREPEIKPEGLKSFQLNIKPMNMIEPEIYLFGPSDLVPDHHFNFKPVSKSEFSLSADHYSSIDQLFLFQTPGKYFWFDFNQSYNRHKFLNSVLESGKAEIKTGNQQLNGRSGQTEILYEVDGIVESKKFIDFPDSVARSSDYFLRDKQDYSFSFSGLFKNNPVINSDLWNFKADLFQNSKKNTIGILSASSSKSLSVMNWITEAQIYFYKDGLVNVGTGLEYENEGWILFCTFGYTYLKSNGSRKTYYGNQPNGQVKIANNSDHIHQKLTAKVNEIKFRANPVFETSSWYLADSNSVNSNFPFPEHYSLNYRFEWIPDANWMLQIETDYSKKVNLNVIDYYSYTRSDYYFLNINSLLSFYFSRSKVSLSHRWNQVFNEQQKNISVAYLPEHSVGLDIDLQNDNETNRLFLGGSYQLKRKVFEDPIHFMNSKFTDFTEIYFKIEDFHARPVKLFAEIKLYLGDNHYYPGLMFEKYNYRAGLSLKF